MYFIALGVILLVILGYMIFQPKLFRGRYQQATTPRDSNPEHFQSSEASEDTPSPELTQMNQTYQAIASKVRETGILWNKYKSAPAPDPEGNVIPQVIELPPPLRDRKMDESIEQYHSYFANYLADLTLPVYKSNQQSQLLIKQMADSQKKMEKNQQEIPK